MNKNTDGSKVLKCSMDDEVQYVDASSKKEERNSAQVEPATENSTEQKKEVYIDTRQGVQQSTQKHTSMWTDKLKPMRINGKDVSVCKGIVYSILYQQPMHALIYINMAILADHLFAVLNLHKLEKCACTLSFTIPCVCILLRLIEIVVYSTNGTLEYTRYMHRLRFATEFTLAAKCVIAMLSIMLNYSIHYGIHYTYGIPLKKKWIEKLICIRTRRMLLSLAYVIAVISTSMSLVDILRKNTRRKGTAQSCLMSLQVFRNCMVLGGVLYLLYDIHERKDMRQMYPTRTVQSMLKWLKMNIREWLR